jgi:hypothetical protein
MASGGSSTSKAKDITPADLVEFRGGTEQLIFNYLQSAFGLTDPSLGDAGQGGAGSVPAGGGASDRQPDGLRAIFDKYAEAARGGKGGSAATPTLPSNSTPAFSDIARLLTSAITPGEIAQLERVRGLAGTTGAEDAAFTNLTETLQGKYLDPNNPILQGYVEAAQRPLLRQNEVDQASARALFTRAGGQNIQSSSPYASAYANLQGSLYNALKDTASQILYPAFQSERQNQLASAQIAPQLAAAIAERNLKVLEAEGLPRLVGQKGIDNALAELDSRRNAISSALAAAAGLARPVTGSSSKSTNVGILS